ncbi:helix-turn-helix domain-containing protein [Candidatus Mycobacterium methanotrophicum]|uniref:Helix-turn-helix domain-containing protein n=1 Tax=Candidatus Mycobacterium methanotrophicum TaxID=2943498 RepID=A0ABY4QQK5_9MYCO|nr:helix-turn-helix domain-containing protein [Candidatus Mycobacterium methanotrophicum]UQX13243.1 helix-turn-helix domain-containing protein [Candidatus Mycobacterium methanotrophicum]
MRLREHEPHRLCQRIDLLLSGASWASESPPSYPDHRSSPRARIAPYAHSVPVGQSRPRQRCDRASGWDWALERPPETRRGKQPKLSPRQEAHLVELYRAGGHTIGELEELFPVTRSTIYRAVARAGGRTTGTPTQSATR